MICTDFCPILWPVGIKNIVADEYSNLLFTCFSIASWCIVLTESNSIGLNIHLLQYFWYQLVIRSDKSRCIWITWLFYYVVTSQKSICYCSLLLCISYFRILIKNWCLPAHSSNLYISSGAIFLRPSGSGLFFICNWLILDANSTSFIHYNYYIWNENEKTSLNFFNGVHTS